MLLSKVFRPEKDARFFFILSSISIIIVLTFQSIRCIILVKKWVFTVLYDTACSFLFLLPAHHKDIFYCLLYDL